MMAFKKSRGFVPNRNLSKKASIAVILLIATAVPLTVFLSQKQQQTQQEAATQLSRPRSCGVYGDLDGNRLIEKNDYLKALDLLKTPPLNDVNDNLIRQTAHVTWDGNPVDAIKVTAQDTLALQKYIATGDKTVFTVCRYTKPVAQARQVTSISTPPLQCLVGDVDEDGYVTYLDATRVAAFAAKRIAPLKITSGDVDNNGVINFNDALMINKYIMGTLQSFPRKCVSVSVPVVPTCRPRPACLDATPRCLIPETPDMCKPSPKPSPLPSVSPTGRVIINPSVPSSNPPVRIMQ